MYIKFNQKYDGHKVGDVADLSVGFAESLIEKKRALATEDPVTDLEKPKKPKK